LYIIVYICQLLTKYYTMKNLSSLAKHHYKLLGSGISLIGIIIYIILLLLNYNYIENWEERIFIMNHYIIIFGFIMLTFSKEKHEDERIQRIRYSMLKFSYALTIIGITVYSAISILDRVHFNLFVIFYIIESLLLIYQVLFRFFSLQTQNGYLLNIQRRSVHFLFCFVVWCF